MSSSSLSICRTSPVVFSMSRLLSRREATTLNERLVRLILTVTGTRLSKSSTRVSVQLFRSNSNGSNSTQPWLITVRLNLKLRGRGMDISIDDFEDVDFETNPV